MEIFKNANLSSGLTRGSRKLILITAIILSITASFGLGRLSVLIGKKEPIAIEGYLPSLSAPAIATSSPAPGTSNKSPEPKAPAAPETYVASKNGKSYYFPWCGTVKRIKPENLIYFNSKTEAEKAGYSPGNCAGLK